MKIGVIGAGTWGIALARMLCRSGHNITVWSALSHEITKLQANRTHDNLPGMVIPDDVSFTIDIQKVCIADILLFAIPSLFVRNTARQVSPFVKHSQIIVDVAKGIEQKTLMTMSEVIQSEIPIVPVVALSGPTHAEEVALDLPTTIVAAHPNISIAEQIQSVFSNPVMRAYTNTDIKGIELCGALKNIIAIAAGISSGLGFGDNAKAALITRGLAEIKRLGVKMDCLPETFSGLAGMGDLIVTATSVHSRNNRCGYLIGQGYHPKDAIKQVGMVVEGINAIPAAIALSNKYDVEMPIVESVNRIIRGEKKPKEAVYELMRRDAKRES